MTVDLPLMQQTVEELYVPMVLQEHGVPGLEALKALLHAISKIYRVHEPERIRGKLTVFKMMDDAQQLQLGEPDDVHVNAQSFAAESLDGATVQVLASGAFRKWRNASVGARELSDAAVVYEYEDRAEKISAKRRSKVVPKLVTEHASMFSVPTFSSLEEALQAYGLTMARNTSCQILQTAWHDSGRLYWKAKPEATMRRSLTQYLRASLRETEVRPEQNVDESHPVDIKVTWTFCNRIALIEIKWLGKARDDTGKVTTTYADARARSGAKQLAEYLDDNKMHAPANQTLGYLTVFDGRRLKLVPSRTTISRTHGLHYAQKNIDYKPAYHSTRDDFAEPIRFFLEPKVT